MAETMAEENIMEFAIDDDDDILDYDDGDDLDFSTDNEEEEEESVIDKPQEYPETPQERINWQEQIRMIHLRSHLNQMAEKVKHANYVVDKTREELKKCRAHMHHLESERDSVFGQIQEQESAGNQSAIYRLRAAHDRICKELEEEQKLETKIRDRLDQAEYDLAVVEVERGKFILAEDELLRQEQILAKDKTEAALHRLYKEQSLARQAGRNMAKSARLRAEDLKEQEARHRQAIEDADRSHERASKYLNKTLEKMRQRQRTAEERYQADMQRKMDMLVKLKDDITTNRAAEDKEKEAEEEVRRRILSEGGNPDLVMHIKKRQSAQEQKRQQFSSAQKQRKAEIMTKILTEEKSMRKRKKMYPFLFEDPKKEKELQVPPHKEKPLKMFDEYVKSRSPEHQIDPTPRLRRVTTADEDEKQDEEKEYFGESGQRRAPLTPAIQSLVADVENLAVPEFEGLWEQTHKPYKVPKDPGTGTAPPNASKMDKEILKKVLEKHREGIVVKQVAAGREFSGRPFYSKPDIIHFKDFTVGSTYKKKVVLTNVSYSINYCKFIDITERLKDFIGIEFNPPGQMSAGMTCEMMVTFAPKINEDLFGEVKFLSQTGPFSIPLHCTTKKCDLQLDVGTIDFGTTVIGETMRRSFTLTNRGALGTKFDFFKVTGMKQRTLTTAGTSLGRLTTASMGGVSPDSEMVTEKAPGDTSKKGSITDKGADSKKRSQEDLEKIPEATVEPGAPMEMSQAEGSEATDIGMPAAEMQTEMAGESEQKGDQEIGEAISPDLAVSEVEDYNLDGMRPGPLVTGEIGPFSSLRLDIIWQPTIPGRVDSEFLVTFADPLSEGLSLHALANAIDVPVWVERQTVDLKICMFDRLYQDTIIVYNRATTALRLKFEVCKELKNHMEFLPKTGYVQAQSQFSAQLKFLPRQSLFEEAVKYFDRDTGVLEAPMIIRVADQTAPVPFTVNAVVTNSDLEFDVKNIDFGYTTVYESTKTTIKLTNKSILPQEFALLGCQRWYVEVQPNDGFGTLLPLETIELDDIFSPSKAFDYKFDLDFKISCVGVGVLPPLQLSHQVVHFAATALYDVSTASVNVVNHHTSSNEFTHPVPRIGTKGEICPVEPTSYEFVVPPGVPLTVSPAVGTIDPGKSSLLLGPVPVVDDCFRLSVGHVVAELAAACLPSKEHRPIRTCDTHSGTVLKEELAKSCCNKAKVELRFSPTLAEEDIRREAVRMAVKIATAQAEKEYEEELRKEREMAEQALVSRVCVGVNIADFRPFSFSMQIQNTSSLAISYVIKLNSQSLRRHSQAQGLPHFLKPDSTVKNFVGKSHNITLELVICFS
ncbi:hypothetical protein BaRGS_00032219 [Batillaria attramentaria]|uniref:Cilia- and flagella-associated protein 74 n=1 Tax=Batillaria attramentaria TaxID=370345 RepID=A0ABD0JNB8_9CAEN